MVGDLILGSNPSDQPLLSPKGSFLEKKKKNKTSLTWLQKKGKSATEMANQRTEGKTFTGTMRKSFLNV